MGPILSNGWLPVFLLVLDFWDRDPSENLVPVGAIGGHFRCQGAPVSIPPFANSGSTGTMMDLSELSDEEIRKLLKPSCTMKQVEETVKKSFGANISILKALDSYDDQNFMAEQEGTYFLVKVHNGFESRDFVESFERNERVKR